MTRDGERGFSLLEVVVVIALTIGVILGTAGAVTSALHGIAQSDLKVALDDDALDALADVRAVTAYGDPTAAGSSTNVLAKLVGKSSTATVALANGYSETLTVSVSQLGARTFADATASAGGVSVSERQSLAIEAPTPGSIVNAQASP